MRNAVIRLILAGALAGAIACGARADDAARKQIQAGYDKFSAAMKAKDVNAIVALSAPGFTEQDGNGPVANAAQAKQVLDAGLKSLKKINSVSMKANKVSVTGNTAIVDSSFTMDAIMSTPDGKSHHITQSGVDRDTWVKAGGVWKVKTVHGLSMHQTMDGKPVSMGAPRPARKK